MEQVYPRIVEFLEEELGKDTSGHSLDHAIRVYKNAKAILKSEGGNERVVLISALVHDVIDSKLFEDSREQQAKLLIFLQTLGCSQVELKEIFYIIENISYKGILSITSTGKGKMTKVEDYNETSRAIKGSLVQKLDDEEELATIYAVPENQEKVFVTANNKAVTLLAKEIPIQGKLTSGVRIIDIRGLNVKVEIM